MEPEDLRINLARSPSTVMPDDELDRFDSAATFWSNDPEDSACMPTLVVPVFVIY